MGDGRKLVLVVEDEEDIQQTICYNLLRGGFRVETATSGEEALEKLASRRVDLVLLDLMLPGLPGMEVCRRVKQDDTGPPVIMLTARSEDDDVVAGLEAGADDYVTKPFSPRVLMARVEAVLRRRGGGDGVIETGPLRIDREAHTVEVDGLGVDLTPTEFAVLCLLASRPGRVFTRDGIIDAVRGHGYAVTPRAVDVQVFGLRRKLGRAGAMIETVRGVGYRLGRAGS